MSKRKATVEKAFRPSKGSKLTKPPLHFASSSLTPAALRSFALSQDGRKVSAHTSRVTPTCPIAPVNLEAPKLPAPLDLDQSDDRRELEEEVYSGSRDCDDDESDMPRERTVVFIGEDDGPRKRYMNSDRPLLTWARYRDQFLDESLRAEGRGLLAGLDCCPDCRRAMPCTVRCRECAGQELTCVECACERHMRLPLHMVEEWNGSFFERVSLSKLGLTVQLGHPPGIACPYRYQPRKIFTVLHVNGIHTVKLYFCGCGSSGGLDPWRQLRRFDWWPAMPLEPQTAATRTLLKHFHLLSLQGKVTAYDYYRTLELQTDNTGFWALPDRRASFMNIIRQYRHIQMMKQGGRGHALEGISGAKAGECAVLCPACPQPGLNLPDGWEDAPEDKQWLYRRIIAMDANFRLKNRLRSSATKARGSTRGWHISSKKRVTTLMCLNTPRRRSCSGFAAIANANTKHTKGLRATGVGAVPCAKHEFWMPVGMGDLQKGEQYCNMDFIFWSTMRGVENNSLIVSYDIACQWSKNLWHRMKDAPTGFELRLAPSAVDFAIPKFHLPAHGGPCQVPFSFNYKLGVGMMDGEAPERNWASLNGAANSTREMGPGARHDTLDDHCGHANWRRVVKMGSSIVRRMKSAVVNAAEHVEVFEQFMSHLMAERPEQVQEWVFLVERWDAKDYRENPYECEKETASLAEVQLKLAQEEAEKAANGLANAAGPGRTAFVLLGMDIEEQQYIFNGYSLLSLQAAQTQESRTAILRQIYKFRAEQEIRMPNVAPHFDVDDTTATSNPENIRLYLPSELPFKERLRFCDQDLINMEAKLREAQASDALDELRRQLRIRTYLNQFKIKNVTGQRPNTQARSLQSRIDVKVKAAAARYRRCRAAYLTLVGPGDWENRLRVLADEDVRGLGERAVRDIEIEEHRRLQDWNREDRRRPTNWDSEDRLAAGGVHPGKSRRPLSWLWFSVGLSADNTDPGLHDALRVEWAKARARAKRWHEEVLRIQEEMANVLRYCDSLSRGWRSAWRERLNTDIVHARRIEDSGLVEGLKAFAERQASMYHRLRVSFNQLWLFTPDEELKQLRAETARLNDQLSAAALEADTLRKELADIQHRLDVSSQEVAWLEGALDDDDVSSIDADVPRKRAKTKAGAVTTAPAAPKRAAQRPASSNSWETFEIQTPAKVAQLIRAAATDPYALARCKQIITKGRSQL
ncbi:hypothetical protein BV25DRAFT_1921198 [Artomyces pyxidatus]|uniref:Uncharacterized protein n=1 Tax=Artomyces pyxidatus TaxID=48021 RepID=A0ACB8SJZ3_9AGAM|nr:hypothetical protein BV25DRAFT_1921198 [Artomyces pyxidatus]